MLKQTCQTDLIKGEQRHDIERHSDKKHFVEGIHRPGDPYRVDRVPGLRQCEDRQPLSRHSAVGACSRCHPVSHTPETCRALFARSGQDSYAAGADGYSDHRCACYTAGWVGSRICRKELYLVQGQDCAAQATAAFCS